MKSQTRMCRVPVVFVVALVALLVRPVGAAAAVNLEFKGAMPVALEGEDVCLELAASRDTPGDVLVYAIAQIDGATFFLPQWSPASEVFATWSGGGTSRTWSIVDCLTVEPVLEAATVAFYAIALDASLGTLVSEVATFTLELRPGNPQPDILDLALIPAGTFTQGSPPSENCRSSNETQRQVTISRTFEMMKTEVTQAAFEAVMGYPTHLMPDCPTCPVENVQIPEAAVFANRVSQLLGYRPAYYSDATFQTVLDDPDLPPESYTIHWDQTANGFRLPTEAEWEYASRGGQSGPFGFPCPDWDADGCRDGSNTTCLGEYAWFFGNSKDLIRPVAQLRPNAYGLYDMQGNVNEWCWDWFADDAYATGPVTDPTGPPADFLRVIRGGGWFDFPENMRSAARSFCHPDRCTVIGFRLVRNP